MHMHTVPSEVREGIFPGTVVIGDCEAHVSAENHTQGL